MKLRSTTPASLRGYAKKAAIVSAAVLVAFSTPLVFIDSPTSADRYEAQIRALQRQIDEAEKQAASLDSDLATLQDELAAIDRERSIIQTRIDLAQAEHDKLQAEIAQTEARIEATQSALGYTIADLYVDDQITPLEMFASSSSIAEYLDRQTYRSSIQDNLARDIVEVRELKAELEQKQVDVKRTLETQSNARQALVEKSTEQQTLIRETRGEQAAYREYAESREREKLRVQQAQQAAIEAAMRAAAGGGRGAVTLPGTSGGYPWVDANCIVGADAYSRGGIDGRGGDGMGYGCRQCTSYVAWKTLKETGYAPVYWGNANQWPAHARSAGFTVSQTPRANSAAVIMAGAYGHVVWVESVDTANGTLTISQYNYFNAGGPGWGHFSRMQVPIGTYQYYIYF